MDRNGARNSGHQTSRPLTHCHPATCPWVPSVKWVRDTSVPPNCRHGKSQWQHTERFAGVDTINHVPVQGDGPQHPHPAICLSIRGHVLLLLGLLTHLSHRYLLTLSKPGRALELRDESECGGLQGSHGSLFSLFPQTGDLGVPFWLSFFLPFLFVLDPFPRSPGCLKPVSSGVCNSCAPSCGPQRIATHLASLPTGALY